MQVSWDFILIRIFPKKNHNLTLVDIQGFDKSEYATDSRIEICDVRNKRKLDGLIKGQDIIIHAAAAFTLEKEDIYTTNIDGTRNVLELAKKHKVKRVVYISSTAVYGIPKNILFLKMTRGLG